MDGYTDATVVHAEGARVGFVSCLLCGATIMLDPRDAISRVEMHSKWHDRLEAAEREKGAGDGAG